MIKIAINGFGRIGRLTCRRILDKHPDLQVAAINDLADKNTLLHLLKYDSVYGVYDKKPESVFLAEPDPVKLPWKKLGVDIVLECTGIFRDLTSASKHIKAGARQVIISAPSKGAGVASFVPGVNQEKFKSGKDKVCDMASCTTNCAAPVIKVLNDNFKIISGFMTTVHAYTTTQRILDLPHKDLRRARAAGLNIIPTTTGAAKAVAKVIPELKGKLDVAALRVPVPTVSILDVVCQVDKKAAASAVNQAFKTASKTKQLANVLAAETAPLVSSDYIANTFSAVVDLEMTRVQDNLVKVMAWYDNEFAYACRLAEFAEFIGKKI